MVDRKKMSAAKSGRDAFRGHCLGVASRSHMIGCRQSSWYHSVMTNRNASVLYEFVSTHASKTDFERTQAR